MKTKKDLIDLFIECEKNVARSKLHLLGGKTREKELSYMFDKGAYAVCKVIAKTLKIKYHFLY